ncbi:aspartate carbamoyltransferase [Shewanella surugensis]|uniref:Aspartate carbamoyltransferase n=1 Tax=Shewanella surugensis TaxID=212020 RepID=A0ABT0L623_9GAMM|nr:aspartate carbamoyltransferase [Shewanella surugensis]MCL1123142.1 aspartate carbamoyltransferase [Shewanella surugensis]
MTQFQGSHILSVNQLDLDAINTIFNVATQMTPYALRQKRTRVLEGAVLGNLFFEPSTRTRVSFGCAFNLLGGHVRETTGMASSSLSKGESLYDTARVLSTYSDVIAMRHPEPFSVQEFSVGSRVPVINGGDGTNEHPTQALLDLFTIQKELAEANRGINGLHIAMVGDLRFGRTVHSLSRLLCMYKNVTFTLVSPSELSMPEYVLSDIEKAGHQIKITDQLEGHLDKADILYLTRIQEERFPSQEEANKYRGKFRLNKGIYTQHCKSNTVIMHPLPRDSRAAANELDNDLNSHPNLAIFRQADNGLLIRMALFALTLGVDTQLKQYESPVNWYSRKADF